MWNKPSQHELAKIPAYGSQSETPTDDVMIYMHFFMGAFDWWISEFDGDDVFFGFACLGDPDLAEWGTVSFKELQALKARVPLIDAQTQEKNHIFIEVDRDLYWRVKPFREIKWRK